MRARWASSFHFVLAVFGLPGLLVTAATTAALEVPPAMMRNGNDVLRRSDLEKRS